MVVKATPQKQIETVFGMANVIESGDKYIIKSIQSRGQYNISKSNRQVVEVTSDSFIVDFNHPLAGETLYLQ